MTGPQRPLAVAIQKCALRLGSAGDEAVVFRLDDFRLTPAEHVALTGPSGCGKSTLLNLVAGLRRPDSGEISVQGTNLRQLSPSRLDTFRGRTMGFVFQSFNLLDSFSTLENVMIGMCFGRAYPSGEQQGRAMALLDRVGLQRRLHTRPSRLSVGERQRVAIARAIANKPALLLADEPTGALDPSTAADIFALIREVCREEQCALLLVTHDLDLAAQLPRQVDCRSLVTHLSPQEVRS
jgi:putative ABC transport system ATP-binding protein